MWENNLVFVIIGLFFGFIIIGLVVFVKIVLAMSSGERKSAEYDEDLM